MSVRRKSAPADTRSDLERTDELPVLDVAAYEATQTGERLGNTDTWIAPASFAADLAESTARAAAVEQQRTELETKLHELSKSFADVEGRLQRKGQRLHETERQLEESRAESRAAADGIVALQAQLDTALSARAAAETNITTVQTALAAADAAHQTLQARVDALNAREQQLASQLIQREQELAQQFGSQSALAADQHAAVLREVTQRAAAREAELQKQLATQDRELRAQLSEQKASYLRQLADQEAAATARFTTREADSASRSAAREAAIAKQATALECQVSALQRDIWERVEREAQHLETLRTLEGRRVLFDCTVLELEMQIAGSSDRIAALEQELLARERRGADLEQELTGRTEHVAALEARVAEQTKTLEEQRLALDAAGARQRALEEQLVGALQQHADATREGASALQASTAHVAELEADLHAAEESINRLEAELRTRSARLDEVIRTSEEWRSALEEARASLEKRDAQVRRLETGAANSAALVGNIEQSIKRLDPLGATGPNELIPEGLTRLLIRTDGDADVVHVLGRRTTIGRTAENDLRIDASYISRHHAVILAGPIHTVIEDLNSTNGVLVNNRRITRQVLRDGDVVMVGKTTFRFATRPIPERR